MSNTTLALAFRSPPEPVVLSAATVLAACIAADEVISRSIPNAVMHEPFGGSDAEGRWSVRDAHAALELAQVLVV